MSWIEALERGVGRYSTRKGVHRLHRYSIVVALVSSAESYIIRDSMLSATGSCMQGKILGGGRNLDHRRQGDILLPVSMFKAPIPRLKDQSFKKPSHLFSPQRETQRYALTFPSNQGFYTSYYSKFTPILLIRSSP